METRFGGETSSVCGVGAANFWAAGKRAMEWDLNNWKWDSDLFVASPRNPVASAGKLKQFVQDGGADISPNRTSSCSEEVVMEIGRGKREMEKKRRVGAGEDKGEAGGSLSLRLGGQGFPAEANGGKKSKITAGGSRTVCQVEGCGLDLSDAKDYHRRHKVCESHSKATKALVGNSLQRFCQQCSRFHLLEEFDEGKRSCRRRLAGHNKRRRKTQPEAAAATTNSQNNDQASSYLLISLLRLISNMHSNNSDQATDKELLSHLLKNVAGQTNKNEEIGACRVLQSTQDAPTDLALVANSEHTACLRNASSGSSSKNQRISQNGQVKMNNFDLNDIYIDSDEGTDDAERSPATDNGNSFMEWARRNSNQSSPPQTSGNSDSVCAQSPSNSGGDGQNRTDRIIFKLFGKEPNDLPLVVRTQILDWLSHSPTDIEGYIRPGCVVLTVYIRQAESAWKDLCCHLATSLRKLLYASDEPFWKTGWMYVMVQHQFALAYNGDILFNRFLPLTSRKILSVIPIAAPSGKNVKFMIKGINLSGSSRLLCALEGNYVPETESPETLSSEGEAQILKYSYDIPSVIGRGFIEVDDDALSRSFFPFIVAEEDVCLEIRMLEGAIDSNERDAFEFLHEMGWLLHNSQMTPFSMKRFNWLLDFSIDRGWRAVLRKLLDVFIERTEFSKVPLALTELHLLHRAVRKNSRQLVEFLLSYVPEKSGQSLPPPFRPDAKDPDGATPLHIAASRDGLENLLDALTSDPQMVGVKAWESARDADGLSPEQYARRRGHLSYIHLVQRKAGKQKDYVAVDVRHAEKKPCEETMARLEINGGGLRHCAVCSEKLAFRRGHGSLVYRPAMLSMIAIAAVCVCAALYFKSCPEVVFVFRPFRWELLDYGAI